MDADLNKLAALRCDRASDNHDVKPVDLLRAMIHDIETGRLKVDGLLLLWFYRPEVPHPWDHGAYRCNVPRDQEVCFLELAKERCIRDWLGRP